MSINYHAYQCRNFRFDDYEKISEQWRETFSGFSPERTAAILDLKYDSEYLYIPYFGAVYRLCLADGRLEKQAGEEGWEGSLWFNEAMVVYHILNYVADAPRHAGEMVSNTDLDPTSVSRNSTREDVLFADFARKVTGKARELKESCLKLGGTEVPSRADCAFLFYPFPQIPLQLIFWDADEDFPAKVQVLVDRYVTDYLHLETTGCMISDLFQKLSEGL